MFKAWELFSSTLSTIDLDRPDTAPGYPDYLKEMKWEMDFVLKMQYADGSGKVSHKLTRLDFSALIMLEDDWDPRSFTDWGSAATADFVAMFTL